MAVLLQQPRGDTSSHRSNNKNSSSNFASPDKTVASTPPNSPGFDTDADFTRFETNVFQQQSNEDDGGSTTGGDGLGPLPTTSSNTAALGGGEGGGGGVVTGSKLSGTSSLRQPMKHSSPSRPRGSTKQLLRVDKILCRVPSHESNISDLSASLSPTGPRGPGPMGTNNKDALSSRAGPKSKDGDVTIMASLLNDCAVFERYVDIYCGTVYLNQADLSMIFVELFVLIHIISFYLHNKMNFILPLLPCFILGYVLVMAF